MRLTKTERELIKKAFQEAFGEGKVYLFGSRIDDMKRGGDIDLYLVPAQKYDDERERRRRFQVLLMEYLGEQKIDIVLAKNGDRLIEKVAMRDGVEI